MHADHIWSSAFEVLKFNIKIISLVNLSRHRIDIYTFNVMRFVCMQYNFIDHFCSDFLSKLCFIVLTWA